MDQAHKGGWMGCADPEVQNTLLPHPHWEGLACLNHAYLTTGTPFSKTRLVMTSLSCLLIAESQSAKKGAAMTSCDCAYFLLS